MRLQARHLGSFLRQPPAGTRVALLHGPDRGLVAERALALVTAVAGDPGDPFRVAVLSPADLREVPSRLADEYAALAFGGGRRAVRLRDAGNDVADAVESVLDSAVEADTLVIVEAGDLAQRDRLRAVCEKHPAAAVIGCYGDDADTIESLAEHVLGQAGLRIEPDALGLLAARLGADRQVSRRELEKLALYMQDAGRAVGVGDVEAVIGDGSPLLVDDLIAAAAEGDIARSDRIYRRCLEAGQSPVSLLRALLRHLQRLHLAAAAVRAGKSADAAMRGLRPPVFQSHQASFRRQLALWDLGRLNGALERVLAAELACKTTGTPAEPVAGRCFMQIAQAARYRPAQAG